MLACFALDPSPVHRPAREGRSQIMAVRTRMAREFAAFLNLTSKDTKETFALNFGIGMSFNHHILTKSSQVRTEKRAGVLQGAALDSLAVELHTLHHGIGGEPLRDASAAKLVA